ncbi:MAG: amidohydrolase [Paracoccus denitrificans]|uniref:Amidohydrolase n=1 Tax=Paracoccus denitrificans TaxID=266 RepID=A0A533HZ21_PARDE|nr:MAG: amidohydrolase [Paracoccus denitrificans]
MADTPAVTIPAEAWDCHVHVFDPARFPYAEARDYTPAPASLDALRERLLREGVTNTVLVQPSVYGTDNRCLLWALRELGPNGRAVAVVDPDRVTDAELADLQAAGVVGMRVNLVASQARHADPFRRMAERLRGSGMFLQIFAPLTRILQQSKVLEAAGLPVVLDHFAGARASDGAEQLDALERLCRDAPVWVKLSADYRLDEDRAAQARLARDLVARLWAVMPERLIWGSDWPHTGGGADRAARAISQIEPFRKVDALAVPRLLAEAGLDAEARRQVLSINPTRLFAR